MTTLSVEIDIEAPIEIVWEVLTDFEAYSDWNRFTPQVVTSGNLGDPVTLRVNLNDSDRLTTSHLIIEKKAPYILTWGDDTMWVKAHRTQSLSQLDNGMTRYRSQEPFGGLLAPIILWLLRDKLMRGYQWAAEGLKMRAESLH